MKRRIAMLSDFGHRDAYVGIMKSVVWRICPTVGVYDLCHDVPPQNLLSANYLLATAMPYLPDGTVVVAVVDPGVGTARRAIAVECDGVVLVGPDNGLFTMAYEQRAPTKAVELDDDSYHLREVSKTFHGRDIFSPAAAHIAEGVDLEELGSAIDPGALMRMPEIGPIIAKDEIRCRIVHVDHFGNAVTNLSRATMDDLDATIVGARIGGDEVPFATTFADVDEGRGVCYVNSTGYLEVGIRNGDAAREFELSQRGVVNVRLEA